ncbi:MAG TPA: carboxylesterase/lipase family protein [Ktedonobacteraceae bacterium]|nr:carboxylesterase/lipase family protein [Ktedonobacteraceae bacterium]
MDTIVNTRLGAVRGSIIDGIATFKGIPYAANPFGTDRFRPPQPAQAWDGVRDALAYGPTSPKPGYAAPFDALLPEPAIAGLDCLNLNVWSPDVGRVGLPVMVWIHGGSFANGSGAVPTYNGRRFARDGAVCVTINYRLGPHGFLYLGEGTANLGLLDQVAALKWVQENIAAFGGDPSNVTIFGESAGAFSVSTLLAMPRAAGLFRRAILQSGAGHHALQTETSRLIGQYLAEKLGVEPTPDGLASVPFERIIAAQVKLANEVNTRPDPARWREVLFNYMLFEPVIDGEILPSLPMTAIAGGASSDVDVMVGTNTEEWRFFTVPNGVIDMITGDILAFAVTAYGLSPAETLAFYREALPGASAGDLQAALVTDWFFRVPAIRLAEARTAGKGATYMYEMAWRSPQFGGRMGACHGLELSFVFDNLDQEENRAMVGDNPPQQLADAMHSAWVAFAISGDPGWSRYDLNRRATMRFDLQSQVVDDPHPAQRMLWEGKR